jgi:hypothetical protein
MEKHRLHIDVKKRLARLLIVALPLVWFIAAPPGREAQKSPAPDVFAATIKPFLEENCYFCHSAKKQSGGFDLTTLSSAESISRERDKWEVVLQKLQTGEMPPKEMPRPEAKELKGVIGWIEGEFDRVDRSTKPDPGRVTARRLNRSEYNNTVHDLLGVDFKPADDFPQDDSGYGFDNIGDVLSLSPVLMEKYLSAAEKLARTALFGAEPLKPSLTRFQLPPRKIKPIPKALKEYDQTGLSLPNALHLTHRFPVDGEYLFKIFLGGNRPKGSEPITIALWVDGKQIDTFKFDPDSSATFSEDQQELGGQVVQMRSKISAGDHWIAATILNLYEGLPARYEGINPSKLTPPPPPEFKPRPGFPPERLAEFKKRFEERQAAALKLPANDGRVNTLEIGGPYDQVKGPSQESLKKIYACGHFDGHHNANCSVKIVRNLARRAYRRPVIRAEVDQLTGLVALAQKRGDSFEEGLALAIQGMLVSPHFLFRIERDARPMRAQGVSPAGPPAGAAAKSLVSAQAAQTNSEGQGPEIYAVNDYELASRLSYFLWSSMPDDELLRAAEQGTLRKPETLAAQVRRMLLDPKSSSMVENFGGQWLELRKLESVKPDRERFPEYEEYLRMSMRRETEMFFQNIIREDRSLVDFIDADYSFLNERLANFYKISGVKGPEFRKVALPPETHRGGILTQAAILTVSSYTTRTSPVLRGKWILENILNAAPPPPPPDVPNLDETKVGSTTSLRQQLEEHRKNPTCASCHSRMDPLGFGLENFDAIGAWRTQDGKFPIDSTGTLPDGRSFQGPAELKTIVKADRDAFTQCMTEKLMTYALGRGLERYDKATVRKIAKNVAARDYRFSSLVLEIVNSLPFQKRKTA